MLSRLNFKKASYYANHTIKSWWPWNKYYYLSYDKALLYCLISIMIFWESKKRRVMVWKVQFYWRAYQTIVWNFFLNSKRKDKDSEMRNKGQLPWADLNLEDSNKFGISWYLGGAIRQAQKFCVEEFEIFPLKKFLIN